MRTTEKPPFSTSHWRTLWANNIANDIDHLRAEYAESGIVSVDIEPWSEDSRLPSEIAFSFLPPARSVTVDPPQTFRLFPANEVLKTATIAIKGRELDPAKRESLLFGDVRVVEADRVEDAIVELLESFSASTHNSSFTGTFPQQETRQIIPLEEVDFLPSSCGRVAGPTPETAGPSISKRSEPNKLRLVLTGWDLALELSVLSRDYPTVLSHFSAWTDMQEQVSSVSTQKRSLSMRSCLRALGLVPPPGARQMPHRAGMDTVRIVAIFLCCINRAQDSPPLSIAEKPQTSKWSAAASRRSYTHNNKIFRSRPYPADEHPFQAELYHDGGSLIQRSGLGLLDLFAEYHPTAVGISHKRHQRAQAWVSLPSPGLLYHFLNNVDGSELDGEVLKAEAHITAGFESMTDQEWDEIQKSRKAEKQTAEEAQKENKRLTRRGKKDLDIELGGMTLFDEEYDDPSSGIIGGPPDIAGLSLDWT